MKPLLTGIARVAAVATLAAVPLSVTATPAAADPLFPIVDGDLDWGVKESFRNYITGPIAGGEITVTDGAEQNADGTFGFTQGNGEYDLATHNVSAEFAGTVGFSGHEGALELEFSQLRVTTDNSASSGALVADVSSKDMSTGETVVYDDVTVADLDLTDVAAEPGDGGYTTLADIPAVLTADGAEAFAGFYTAGTELDPVTISVKAEAGGGPGDEPGDDPSGTIKDGYADWGVKESFRNYITGPIADGSIDLSDGATDNGDGFRFPKASGEYDEAADTLSVSFIGGVRFLGHLQNGHYELDLTFTDIAVEVTGDDAGLYANGVHIADITLPEDGLTVDGDVIGLVAAPTTLTADGAAYFEGFYQEGDALDPLTLQLALTDDADVPGGNPGGGNDGTTPGGPSFGSGTLPTTGSPLTLPITLGVALVAAGAVALWWSRRSTAA